MRYLLAFGNKGYKTSLYLLAKSALATSSVDEVIMWDDEMVRKTPFYQQNKKILDQRRGAGYWLWKPFIILEEVKKLKQGDFLIYSDSKMLALENCAKLFELCEKENGVLIFSNVPQTIQCWCKRDALVLTDMDRREVIDSFDFAAMMSVWQNTPQAIAFLEDWLKYCCDERILTDMPNTQGLPNYPMFIDHRHDQTVFSLMAIKHNIKGHRIPNQYGKRYMKCEAFKDDTYGQLFQAHFSLSAMARNLKMFPKMLALVVKELIRGNKNGGK